MYRIGEFSKKTGISKETLRLWDRNGKFKPAIVTKGKQRMYSDEQLMALTRVSSFTGPNRVKPEKLVIGYCRVSSKKQAEDLSRQEDAVRSYLIAQGKPFRIISDTGSGINDKNSGLTELIALVMQGTVDKIVVLHKDRLVRPGYDLIESVCSNFNTRLEVIDSTPNTNEQELVRDMIQIVTVFSGNFQGKRAGKARKIIDQMKRELLDRADDQD